MTQRLVAASQPTPTPSVPTVTNGDSDPPLRGQPVPSADTDEARVLRGLKEMIAEGDRTLDVILDRIADAAWRLTGASGAAIAMWKEGEVVCRARAGANAPPLGARLSAEYGISGACLGTGKIQQCDDTQTDPRVDAEVCRHLGLRSIVALPIQAWREVNGILEVFSTQSQAFTGQHVTFLQQLTVLAEWARSSRSYTASAAPKVDVSKPQTSSLMPRERIRAVAAALRGRGWRPFQLGGAGLLALMLMGFVIWLGWRGPSQGSSNTRTKQQSSAAPAQSLGGDFVGKQPAGNSVHLAKAPAGIPVKLASKVDPIAAQNTPPNQGPVAGNAAAAFVVRPESSSTPAVETAQFEPPPEVEVNSASSPLSGVPSATPSLPELASGAISRVSNGYPTHRVPPKYPAQALQLRLGGRVILEAVILEDGSVGGLKVVEGDPILAQAALGAIQQWRYKPYELDGKPVKMKTTITVNFKLP